MSTQPTYDEAAEMFAYNPETGVLTWRISRGQVRKGKSAGSVDTYGYRRVKIHGVKYAAHRVIWLLAHGTWPTHYVDHINGVRDDNKLANLRAATPYENRQNHAVRRNNKTGFTGAMYDKRARRWRASITVNRQAITLGLFDTLEAAAEAYRAAKRKHHKFHPSTPIRKVTYVSTQQDRRGFNSTAGFTVPWQYQAGGRYAP